jgi:hypothetical protein
LQPVTTVSRRVDATQVPIYQHSFVKDMFKEILTLKTTPARFFVELKVSI